MILAGIMVSAFTSQVVLPEIGLGVLSSVHIMFLGMPECLHACICFFLSLIYN